MVRYDYYLGGGVGTIGRAEVGKIGNPFVFI